MSKAIEEIIRENATPIARADAERKHLEGLLKDRINFHLLFGSVFMLGLLRIDDAPLVRAWALAAITVVSVLISLAVLRTHRLVQEALEDIVKDETHPYKKYRDKVRFLPNANKVLVWVPVVLTLAFGIGTFYFFKQAARQATSATSGRTAPGNTTAPDSTTAPGNTTTAPGNTTAPGSSTPGGTASGQVR